MFVSAVISSKTDAVGLHHEKQNADDGRSCDRV